MAGDGFLDPLAERGFTVEDATSLPGDDARRDMAFVGFAAVTPPPECPTLFDLGEVVVTPGARTVLSMSGAFDHDLAGALLCRFVSGDWGEETPPERLAEDQAALGGGGRIASCYPVGYGMVVWLVSEWDRTLTSFVGAGEFR